MSTILYIISVKYFVLMIFIAMITVWIAAIKYSEAKQRQRKENEAFKVAVTTAIAIFAGQTFWWAIKKIRSRIIWESWIKKEMEPKPRLKPSPKQRAASLMSN